MREGTFPETAALEEGAQPVPRIARAMMLDRQPVQRLVDQLRAARLVDRVPNPEHRRSVLVRATTAGAGQFARIRNAEMRDLHAIASGLRERDVEACRRVLEHLAREFAARAAAPAEPR